MCFWYELQTTLRSHEVIFFVYLDSIMISENNIDQGPWSTCQLLTALMVAFMLILICDQSDGRLADRVGYFSKKVDFLEKNG